MKNLFLKITFLTLITFTGYGQDKGKSQIEASIGILTTEDIIDDALVRLIDSWFPENKNERIKTSSVFVTYKYLLTEKIAIGGTAGYNNHAQTFDYNRYKSSRKQILTLAGEGNFYYLKKRNISLYALAGAGCFIVTADNSDKSSATGDKLGLAIQLTPLGVRFGRKFGGFAEIGYGYKGLVNMGIDIKL